MRVDTAKGRAIKGGEVASQKGCSFCQLMLAHVDSGSKKIWDTVLFESENFVVVPTLGAFVEGWVLIVSREHYFCVGAMPKTIHAELETVTDRVTAAIRDAYGAPTVFEHGPSGDGEGIGCGIDHAHLHAVALPFALTPLLQRSDEFHGLFWSPAHRGFSDLSMLHEAGHAYVYVKEPDAHMMYCTPTNLPCQSVRRAMAREVNMGQRYDYHEHPFAVNVERTLNRLARCF